MKKLVALILLISTPVFGDVNVVHLLHGEQAPFEGYLFTPKMEASFRLTSEQLDYQKQINLDLTDLNTMEKSEVAVMQERITNQNAEIKELSSKGESFFGHVGYFMLGSVLTSIIAFGAVKATR